MRWAATRVTLPSWRLDLEREIDLIEEVARVFGYNRFANTLPTPMPVRQHEAASQERAVRTRLLALGFTEAISSTFASVAEAALFRPETAEERTEDGVPLRHVAMENPLSAEASLLRPTLLPGMLGMLAHNLNRDVREARLFEQGQVFLGTADGEGIGEVKETASLVLGMTSAAMERTPLLSTEDAPIFEMKGVVESLPRCLRLVELSRWIFRVRICRRGWSLGAVGWRCCTGGRLPRSGSSPARSRRRASCGSRCTWLRSMPARCSRCR